MAYKLFSTGEVLTAANVNNYLMNQTVMVFASAAARTTALSGVLAEGMISYRTDSHILEYYTGTAWTAVGSLSPLTTKGDLYTYSTTNASLPVGSDGQTLVANSSQTTGLAYTNNFAAGKNAIINGAFNVWQRGTSFTVGAGAAVYTSDRYYYYSGTSGAATVSQQTFTPGTAPVSGYEGTYFYRINQTSGASTNPSLEQKIENVRTFAGQTVTVSFWAKSAGTSTFGLNFLQNFGTGGSPSTTVSTTAIASGTATTTGWQRFTASVALPSISGKTIGTSGDYLDVNWYWPTSTTYTFDIWGVQVEAGSVATAFQTATGTVQGELAACQRYYWRFGGNSVNQRFGNGLAYTATAVFIQIVPPVPMRVSPTAIEYSTLMVFNATQTLTPSAIALNNSSPFVTELLATTSGAIVNSPFVMSANSSTSAYLAFTAEL
jgi:hypothetical protein